MINSLQSLRGIFAVLIFLHHCADFDAGGDSGVCFFIMLSGFVLCAGYQHRIDLSQVSLRGFMNKRLSKVYPLHVVTLIAAIILQRAIASATMVAVWLSNLLLLQSWIPIKHVYFSGNGVAWCLSDLAFCYLMFPLIIKVLHRLRKAQPKLLTVVIATLICAYFVIIRFIPENMVDAFVYVNPAFRLLDFFIGILLWQLYRGMTDTPLYRRIIRIPKGVKTIIEAVAVTIFCAFTLCYPFVQPVYSLASYWWIPTAILILTFSVFSEQRGWLSELLNRSFLIKFGNISFSFYMIHTLVYLYLKIILTKLNILPANALMLIVTFILTTILAYTVNRWFEKPMASLWMSRFGFRAR